MNTSRTWSTRRRLTLTAVGVAAAAAVAVPGVALASSTPASSAPTSAAAASSTPAAGSTDPTCTPAQRWDALAVAAPKVAAYLDAHPDLSAELATLKALPKDQRRAAARTWFAAHPDEKAGLRDARADLRTLHRTCHG